MPLILRSILTWLTSKFPSIFSGFFSFLTGALGTIAVKGFDLAGSAAKSIIPQAFEFVWKIGPAAFIGIVLSQTLLPYFSAALSFFFYTVNAMVAFALAPLVSESALRIVVLYCLGLFFLAVGSFVYSFLRRK